mgnify:CR=1 FL=1
MAERKVLSKESAKSYTEDELRGYLSAYEVDKAITWGSTMLGAGLATGSMLVGISTKNETTDTLAGVGLVGGSLLTMISCLGTAVLNSASNIIINEAESRGFKVQTGFVRSIKKPKPAINSDTTN